MLLASMVWKPLGQFEGLRMRLLLVTKYLYE
jgi:hypothetical protein